MKGERHELEQEIFYGRLTEAEREEKRKRLEQLRMQEWKPLPKGDIPAAIAVCAVAGGWFLGLWTFWWAVGGIALTAVGWGVWTAYSAGR